MYHISNIVSLITAKYSHILHQLWCWALYKIMLGYDNCVWSCRKHFFTKLLEALVRQAAVLWQVYYFFGVIYCRKCHIILFYLIGLWEVEESFERYNFHAFFVVKIGSISIHCNMVPKILQYKLTLVQVMAWSCQPATHDWTNVDDKKMMPYCIPSG